MQKLSFALAQNNVLNYGDKRKKKANLSQTHGEGYLRKFFDTIKGASNSALGRVFVTGVSPVTMDDLTSGFNIGTNYSLSPRFNEMTGFTEEEVREMLTYYAGILPFNHTVDELINVMKPWYDNYCFAEESYGKTTMYNSVMVLNFLDNYINNSDYHIPKNMVETNIRIDYDNFLSLLFYFGMVTIDGTYQGMTKFIIPNEVVRDYIRTYLLDT